MAADWQLVKALFDEAMAMPQGERRACVLAITADEAVRAEVLSLLEHATEDADGLVGIVALPRDQAGDAERTSVQCQRLGPWEVTGMLGTGGMGDVLRARRADGAYEGEAAIKILKRGMDSAALLARFAQEQQALARMNHPHVARLFDAGLTPDGRPYFVMELVEGLPIDRAAQGRSVDERLRLFLQLADAVAHAHQQLLVHRDLKPSNVLVDAQGRVKLLDFGIAKAIEGGDRAGATTQQGQRPFTPLYASPEQVRGEPVGTGTDIYSLGVLLYQMLTGLRPYGRDATTPQAAVRSVLEDAPTRPSSLSPGLVADPQWMATRRRLVGDLDNILLKALEKPVERRYPTVQALAADIQAYLGGYPVSARPASVIYLLGKFVARNRWAVLASTLGGVGLATGLAAALLQGRVAAGLGVIGLAGGLGVALIQGRQAMLARDLAQTRLAEARAIASDVMVRHADAIHYLPGGLSLKAELLQNMIAHLDRLALQAGPDTAFAGELAMAYSRLADLQADHGLVSTHDSSAADTNARKAIALFESSQQACAANPEHAIWWARAWRSRAQVARADGDVGLAMQHIERTITIASAGVQRYTGNSDLLADLGSAHLLRGQLFDSVVLDSLRQPEAAMDAFAEAEAIYRRVHDAPSASRDDTLSALHQLGTIAGARLIVRINQGRAAEAVQFGRAALDYRRQTVALEPDHVGYRNTLASEANNLATCHLDAGDAAQALECMTLARETLSALARDDPAHDRWGQTLRNLGLHEGRALIGLGRAAEAVPLLQLLCLAPEAAASAHERRRGGRARLALAKAWRALGRHDEAVAAVAQACCELQPPATATSRADIDAWLWLGEAQRLAHDLAPPTEQDAWRAAFEASKARARACGELNALQAQAADWTGAATRL